MNANYNESSIAGTKWRRSFRVQIDNPYQGTPRVFFHEEDCISLVNNEVIKIGAGGVAVEFDAAAQFPLVNPWTGEPMTNVDESPQMASHIEAYILLHSLYIHTATLRDTPPPQTPDVPETPPE